MAALTVNTPRSVLPDPGATRKMPLLSTATVKQGGFIGRTSAGKLRSLTAGDAFAGVAWQDAADIAGEKDTLEIVCAGTISNRAIAGAADGDASIGALVYATTDDDLTLTPSRSLVGQIVNHEGANRYTVRFDADAVPTILATVLGNRPIVEAVSLASGSKTLDAEDTGKALIVTGDATNVITLPATAATLDYLIIAAAPGVRIAISPNANDKIDGPDVTGVDNKDRILTAATARAGDRIRLVGNGVGGWFVAEQSGIWAVEP